MNEFEFDDEYHSLNDDYEDYEAGDEEKLVAEALLEGDNLCADNQSVRCPEKSKLIRNAGDIKECFLVLVKKIHLKDGNQLTELELDKAIGDASLTGPLSRVAAILKKHIALFNGLDPAEPGTIKRVTKNAIESFDILQADVATGKNKTKEAVEIVKKVDAALAEMDRLVRNTVRSPFADAELPVRSIQLECVRQSSVGNCYFYSAVASLVAADAGSIRRMISENPDGSYTVKFPGRQVVTVQPPSDAEIYLYPKEGKHGTWMWILEKAYGQSCMSDIRSIAFHAALFRRPGGRPQEYTWGPGLFDEGLRAVTGKSVEWSTNIFPKQMRETLVDLFSKPGQAVVTADATINVRTGKDAPRWGHTFSVLDYDKRADEVILRNPWGHGTPRNPNVRDLGDGKFAMKFKDFCCYFSRISYSRLPATK